MTYTRDYFIQKFEAIEEDQWLVGEFEHHGRCCALGHCGHTGDGHTEESRALRTLLEHHNPDNSMHYAVFCINDNEHPSYKQPTPKQRILAALRDLPSEATP